MKPAIRKNNKPVKSLIKALRILDALGDCPSGLGITQLSETLKAPKSTVHRLIATLETVGYTVFDPPTAKYMLGTKLARLGEQLSHQSSLLTFGVPILEELTRECGEASHLAIMEGTEVVYISREESKEPMRISYARGPNVGPDGEGVTLDPLPKQMGNPIAYFVDCIRKNKPIEDPVSSQLNVQVMEILDAARESARTGKPQELR